MSIGSTDVDFKEIYDAINGAGAHPGTSGTPIGMDSFYNQSFSDGTSTPASGTIGIGGYPEGTNNMRGKTVPLILYDFTSHEFTNCTAIGKSGPILANCTSSYPAWASDTNFFNMISSGIQEWTVPTTSTYEIQAWGPDARNRGGGYGAIIGGEFVLQKGSVIKILVGQRPNPYNGNNGGGAGGTFVVKSPYNTNASILVIAGGAGGAHNISEKVEANGQSGTSGGIGTTNYAGGTNGGAGATAYGSSGSGFFGDGASSMNADRGGKSFTNGGSGGFVDSTYQAGFGGGGAHGNSHGGGAGGYSGGGGSSDNPYVGGGGGSYNSGANKTTSVGTWVGQGKVKITNLLLLEILFNQTGTPVSASPFAQDPLWDTVLPTINKTLNAYKWVLNSDNSTPTTLVAETIYRSTNGVNDSGVNMAGIHSSYSLIEFKVDRSIKLYFKQSSENSWDWISVYTKQTDYKLKASLDFGKKFSTDSNGAKTTTTPYQSGKSLSSTYPPTATDWCTMDLDATDVMVIFVKDPSQDSGNDNGYFYYEYT